MPEINSWALHGHAVRVRLKAADLDLGRSGLQPSIQHPLQEDWVGARVKLWLGDDSGGLRPILAASTFTEHGRLEELLLHSIKHEFDGRLVPLVQQL